jgi:pSer/pThr/pTyr-binding forkhead associated (FHA) protein
VHCVIEKQGPQYVLVDGGSPMGTGLNGQRIASAYLNHGDQINIGGLVLQFLVKNQAAPVRGPEAYSGQAYPLGGAPMPGHPAGVPAAAAHPMPQPAPGMPQGVPHGMPPGMPAPGSPTQAMPSMGGSMPTMAYGAGAPSSLTLVAIDGPILGQRFPVQGPLEVGREASGIRLAHDANASRRHAVFQPGMGAVTVQDLGSTNGTFVNGQRVSQATAGPNDTIKIGSTTFRVEAA